MTARDAYHYVLGICAGGAAMHYIQTARRSTASDGFDAEARYPEEVGAFTLDEEGFYALSWTDGEGREYHVRRDDDEWAVVEVGDDDEHDGHRRVTVLNRRAAKQQAVGEAVYRMSADEVTGTQPDGAKSGVGA